MLMMTVPYHVRYIPDPHLTNGVGDTNKPWAPRLRSYL